MPNDLLIATYPSKRLVLSESNVSAGAYKSLVPSSAATAIIRPYSKRKTFAIWMRDDIFVTIMNNLATGEMSELNAESINAIRIGEQLLRITATHRREWVAGGRAGICFKATVCINANKSFCACA